MMKKFRLDRRHRLFKDGYTVGLRFDPEVKIDNNVRQWGATPTRKIKYACIKVLGSEYDDLFSDEPYTKKWRSYWGRRYPNVSPVIPFHHSRPFFVVFQKESDMIMVLLAME